MNTRLLKLATRDRRGVRRWTVPGHSNGIVYLPKGQSKWPDASALQWPAADPRDGSPGVRGVRLDWHWKLAKTEIRALLATLPA